MMETRGQQPPPGEETHREHVVVLGRESPVKAAVSAAVSADRVVASGADAAGDSPAVVLFAGGDDPLGGIVNDVPDPDRVMAALSDLRPRRLVLIDSAYVYGAHPGNPVPIPEDSPIRPNEGLPALHRQAELERRLTAYARDRGLGLAVLRCAPVVAGRPGTASPFSDRRRIGVRGSSSPCQFLHEADLAAAVRHVLDRRLVGIFDVAPDGWLTVEEVDRIAGRPGPLLELSFDAHVRWTLRRQGSTRAAASARTAALRYPVVVSTTALRRSGWEPQRSNAMALRTASEADRRAREERSRRRRRLARPALVLLLAASAAARVGYERRRRSLSWWQEA